MITNTIKAYALVGTVAVLSSLLGLQTWRLHTAQINEAKAITTLATERATSALLLAEKQDAYREAETSLNNDFAETRKVTHEQITSLTVQRDFLLQRVRRAQAATTGTTLPSPTSIANNGKGFAGNPGTELLGSFGEEDVVEANRADTIRLHLKACYIQYDRAQEALRKLVQ